MKVQIILPKGTFEPTHYKLLEPVHIAGHVVPPGFVTDGASVPRLLWWLFPPTGRYFKAAAVHDWLLDGGYHWREANKKFREALEEQGVSKWVIFLMFWAVQGYQAIKHLIKY